MQRYEEFRTPKDDFLPQGVALSGYRYKAYIPTRNGMYCLGEFNTPEEAEVAIKNAQHETWNG